MVKLIFVFFIVLCIAVIIREAIKKSKQEAELESVHEELEKVDIADEVLDVKLALKDRQKELEKKNKKLVK